jgi:hypothetical protein
MDRPERPKQVKPTDTERVTLVQGACTDGSLIPPFVTGGYRIVLLS